MSEEGFSSGDVRFQSLDSVRPNDWNPNKVPTHKYESIKLSMKKDGWLSSQPLLVWETDEGGKKRMLIIDGEHRWRIANELGYTEGPMVFLNGITKAKAIELTIKLDNNRGAFDRDKLSQLMRESLPSMKDPALVLGFTQTEVERLMQEQAPKVSVAASLGNDLVSHNSVTKMVPVYLSKDDYQSFIDKIKLIGDSKKLETITHVIVAVVREYKLKEK